MTPPRLARWLLARAVSRDERPYLLAEADEEFESLTASLGGPAARRWYWVEAFGAVLTRLGGGGGRPVADGSPKAGRIRLAIRQSARALRRQPVFVLIVVTTLTLGVSAATTVFSLAEAILLRSLPYRAPSGLVSVSSFDLDGGVDDRDISGPDYFDILSQNRVFAEIAAYEIAPATLENREGRGIKIEIARVTPQLFGTLGVQASVGRLLLESEIGPAAPRHVVVSTQLTTTRFGDAESAVGSTIRLDGEAFLVVGVTDRRPPLDGMDVDAWVPLPYGQASLRRQAGVLRVIARLGDDVAIPLVQADLDRIGMALESAFPDSNHGRRYLARSLGDVLSAEFRPGLAALTLAVVLLLIIAVVNASSLLLVRYAQRGAELNIRTALGASRFDVVTQLLCEGMWIGVVAGVSSLVVTRFLLLAAPLIFHELTTDVSLNILTVSAGVGTAFCASLLAAGLATVSVQPGAVTHRRGGITRSGRTRSVLLAGQMAATTVLIVCIAMLGRSLQQLMRVDPGFNPQNLVTAAVDLPAGLYPTDMREYPRWPAIQAFYERVSTEMEAIPSVTHVAVAWHHPMKRGWLTRFLPEGAPEVPVGERDFVNLRAVSPGYFRVVGAAVLDGRVIAPTDLPDAERVVLVNRTLRDAYFGDDPVLGRRVHFFGQWWRIIGVVSDFKSHGLGVPTRPAVFPPLKQMPSETVHLIVRGTGGILELEQGLRDAVWRTDPTLAPYDVTSLDAVLAGATAERRVLVLLFGWFGALALSLSIVGLAVTVNECIDTRRHELGLRAALGARPRRLVSFVLRGNVTATTVGVTIGLVGAFGLTRFLEGWLFRVSSASLGFYALSAVLMIAFALPASVIPALAVLRCDPRVLLRSADR